MKSNKKFGFFIGIFSGASIKKKQPKLAYSVHKIITIHSIWQCKYTELTIHNRKVQYPKIKS